LWESNTGWLGPAGTECAWYGVICNEEQSSVIALNLRGNTLSETFPETIEDLTNLQSLDLSDNYFQQIPAVLGNLSNLQDLNLSSNLLDFCHWNCVPQTFENLTRLRYLDLSDNSMHLYAFPGVILKLTSLQVLEMQGNQFEGGLPDGIGDLTELQHLDLSGCFIEGPIPASLGNLYRLRYLNLSRNYFEGTIPASIGRLSLLQDLDLSYNDLSGPLPESFASLSGLRSLSLICVQLGYLPEVIGNLTSLENLYLDGTGLSSLPAFLGSMNQLRILSLSGNHLGGSVPDFLGNLAQLEMLNLSYNEFSGGIPEFFGSMINLKELALDSNPLGGVIPESLQYMRSLEGLGLNDIQLGGSIPDSLGHLTNLRSLQIAANQLSGSIPASLGNLLQLESLGLLDNRLSGAIPATFGNLSRLYFLNLGGNQLSGSIPETLGNLVQLEYFDANSNNLTGEIPSSFSNLTLLYTLSLRNNQLSGQIPSLAMRMFGGLNLGMNHLSGALPLSISNLRHIILDGNMLSGGVPEDFAFLGISTLNLGYNALYPSSAEIEPLFYRTKFGHQTLAPKNLVVSEPAHSSAKLSWIPINYKTDSGRYEIYVSTTRGGPYSLAGTTASKSDSCFDLFGLAPSTTYFVTIRTVTDPNANNPNTVQSEFSDMISFTTSPSLYSILVATNPSGRAFAVDGTVYNSAQTFSWEEGSSHTIAVMTLQESGGTRYSFADWSDGGAISHTVTVPDDVNTYTANFATEYRLAASCSPSTGATISASPVSADGYYPSGTMVRLTALARIGYTFSSWSGDLTGAANPQTVIMSAPRTVSAAFSAPRTPPSRKPTHYRSPPRSKQSRSIPD
jgi:Leucine-rich repeat (LRR) protein